MIPDDDELCENCPHDFATHLVVAFNGNPSEGGVIACRSCTCHRVLRVLNTDQPQENQ